MSGHYGPKGWTPGTPDSAIRAAELLAGVTIVKPGDALIFRLDQPLTQEQAWKIRQQIVSALPQDTAFLVIGSDVELFVTREEDNNA